MSTSRRSLRSYARAATSVSSRISLRLVSIGRPGGAVTSTKIRAGSDWTAHDSPCVTSSSGVWPTFSMGTSWMYTRSSGRKIASARTCRVPSISCFFASLVSPDGPVMVTTGMALLLHSDLLRLRLSDDDFSKRLSCLEVPERAPRIVKRKDAIDQRPEPVHRDGTIHLGELSTVSREDDPDRGRGPVQDIDINR